MNKVTSLLVAAAAIVSIIPANAADYTKVDAKEGTVYKAVAIKMVNSLLMETVDKKDEAAYYLTSGKYNELEDVDSGSYYWTYGTKYINVEDGNYLLIYNW